MGRHVPDGCPAFFKIGITGRVACPPIPIPSCMSSACLSIYRDLQSGGRVWPQSFLSAWLNPYTGISAHAVHAATKTAERLSIGKEGLLASICGPYERLRAPCTVFSLLWWRNTYMLERLALEYVWRTEHGTAGNPETDPEQCIGYIMHYMGGALERYRGYLSDTVLMDLVKRSCMSYASGTRKVSFADTLLRTIQTYCRHTGTVLPRQNLRAEQTAARAYTGGNGYNSYCIHDFTSVPEQLNMGAKVGRTLPEPSPDDDEDLDVLDDGEETDEQLSSLIDSILGF